MKAITINSKNFVKDISKEKYGAQEGWFGTLNLNGKNIYGVVKLDNNNKYSAFEILFSSIAHQLQITAATYMPIKTKFNGKITAGVFSPTFLNQDETLIFADSLLYKYNTNFKIMNVFNFDNLFKNFDNYHQLLNDYLSSAFFSMVFMNMDFVQMENSQIIQNNKTNQIRMSPLYDLSFCELFKLIQKKYTTKEFIKKIIHKRTYKSFCALQVEGYNKETSYDDSLIALSKRYKFFARDFYDKLDNFYRLDGLKNIINQMYADKIISRLLQQKFYDYCRICITYSLRILKPSTLDN